MTHHHSHHARISIRFVALLNLLFAVIEFVAGWLFHSTALLSDAVHDTGDAFTLLFSALVEKLSKKKATDSYSYGFRRLNLITAIFNSMLLLLGTVLIAREAIFRLLNPEPVNSAGMFIMSLLGITVNLYAVLGLKGSKNILNRSVILHLAEDLLGWVAVFITSIIIYLTGWYILDPIASLGIACFILISAGRNLYQSYGMIMMMTSDLGERSGLVQAISQLAGVITVYDVHYWTLDGEAQIFTAKVLVAKGENPQLLRQAINQELSPYHITCSTIEFIWEEGQEGFSEDL